MSETGSPLNTPLISAPTPAEVNFRWNFSVNVLDISFFMLGLNIVSQTTILPLLVSQLTSSKLAVGLIPAIFSLGFLLPQLLTAGYTESLPRKLPFLRLYSGIFERTPYLVIGLVVWLFAESAPTLTLVAFFLLVLIAAGTSGILTPAWFDLIAKVIPTHRRGIYSGVGNGLGAFMGIAGAGLAGWFLTRWPFPQNYALCFLAASVCFAISWVGLALNREPDNDVVKVHAGLGNYLKKLPAILRRDRNYQVFLLSRSVTYLGTMAAGFFIVYGSERFRLSGEMVGGLTAMLVGSQALWNLLWGLLADRKGYKIVLVGTSLAMALAALVGLLAYSAPPSASLLMLWLVFFLVGVSVAGEAVSGLNIILEFCPPEDRPTYIGLTNTLLAPVKTLGPLLGGWLATVSGYPALFLVAVVAAALGGVMLQWWVREPRK